MDTPEKPKHRKRLVAVAAIWLLLPGLYAVSFGPASYCVGRRWLRSVWFERVYGPGSHAADLIGLWPEVEQFYHFCRDAGKRDAGP